MLRIAASGVRFRPDYEARRAHAPAREAAHVRWAARHHDVANEHVDTLSALIDKANEAATESKEIQLEERLT